jgi:hypothetical protein
VIATPAFLIVVLVVASIGGAAHGFGVDFGGRRIHCDCQSSGFLTTVLIVCIPLMLLASCLAAPVIRYVRQQLWRWCALTTTAMLPFLAMVNEYPKICHLALGPCMIAATLVERWTRPWYELPLATMVRPR